MRKVLRNSQIGDISLCSILEAGQKHQYSIKIDPNPNIQ